MFFRILERTALVVAGIAALLMVAHVSLSLLIFHATGHPIDGTIEIAQHYYMVPLLTLPLISVQYRNEHINVDLLVARLPKFWQSISHLLSLSLMLSICVCLVYFAGADAIAKTVRGESAETANFAIPIWPVRWLIPITYFGIGLVCVAQIFKRLRPKEAHDSLIG